MLLLSLLLALASGVASAACPPVPPDLAEQVLQEGDAAFAQGRRGEARCDWKAAARAARDPATVAMAQLRLLRGGGNLGLVLHGPRADRALDDCPVDRPACRLARADRALILTELGLQDESVRAARLLAELEDEPGMAEAVAARRAEDGVPSPGTWSLGLGLVGAPGLGLGPLLRLDHPDLFWRAWRLQGEAWATSEGAYRLAAGLQGGGRAWVTAGGAAAHLLVPVHDPDGDLLGVDEALALQLRAAPGLRLGPWSAWLGPEARVDRPAGEDWTPGHGLWGGTALQGGQQVQARLVLSGEGSLWGPDHLLGTADLRLFHGAPLGARLGWRLLGTAAPLETSPTWRLPAWGGGEVLRSVPLGRFRSQGLAGAVVEWRQPVAGPLGLVFLGELLALPERHGGGGLGMRLLLPPRPGSTLRLDFAAGDAGWALSTGVGESF